VNDIDDFVVLLRDEIGLPVTAEDTTRALDDVPGWDSMHLLTLLTLLERRTGQRISLPDVLQAGTLERIYELAVTP
jgi:acyl carrier protein